MRRLVYISLYMMKKKKWEGRKLLSLPAIDKKSDPRRNQMTSAARAPVLHFFLRTRGANTWFREMALTTRLWSANACLVVWMPMADRYLLVKKKNIAKDVENGVGTTVVFLTMRVLSRSSRHTADFEEFLSFFLRVLMQFP